MRPRPRPRRQVKQYSKILQRGRTSSRKMALLPGWRTQRQIRRLLYPRPSLRRNFYRMQLTPRPTQARCRRKVSIRLLHRKQTSRLRTMHGRRMKQEIHLLLEMRQTSLPVRQTRPWKGQKGKAQRRNLMPRKRSQAKLRRI